MNDRILHSEIDLLSLSSIDSSQDYIVNSSLPSTKYGTYRQTGLLNTGINYHIYCSLLVFFILIHTILLVSIRFLLVPAGSIHYLPDRT